MNRGTVEESLSIRDAFPRNSVESLLGKAATEQALRAGVNGRQVVHVAAHGFADATFGNQFGAVALSVPNMPDGPTLGSNDGFLCVHEISSLPLQDCELAVLSSCSTSVGPNKPLEAGVTLANAFLIAGARRVIARHWEVEDESTAELMKIFFTELAKPPRQGEQRSPARALHVARNQIRAQPKWSSPYFWGPFSLSGSCE